MRVWILAISLIILLCGFPALGAPENEEGLKKRIHIEEPAQNTLPLPDEVTVLDLPADPVSGFSDLSIGTLASEIGPEADTLIIPDDHPYNDIFEEDIKWKRMARIHGTRLRRLYGPRVAYQGGFINSAEESGSRHTFAGLMPISELWEGVLLDNISFFFLEKWGSGAGR